MSANSLLQKLLPEYAAAATVLKEEEQNGGAKVVLAKVRLAKRGLALTSAVSLTPTCQQAHMRCDHRVELLICARC